MKTNDANKKLIHKELSYKLVGILYQAHNTLGRYARENQYCNLIEKLLREAGVSFAREKHLSLSGDDRNKADFIVENSILLELKAKPFIEKSDYYQVLRYLEASNLKLGMIVNFRSKYLRPKRIINPKN